MTNGFSTNPQPVKSPRRWQSRFGVDDVWVQGQLSSQLFLSLRWIALVGQSVTLVVADRMGVEISWVVCLSVLGFTLLSNALMEWWNRIVNGDLGNAIFHVALWDLISLTILLYHTGGLDNPFAIFYLVQLTIVAVALRYEGIVGLTVGATVGCGFLWFYHDPLILKSGALLSREVMTLGRFVALFLSGATILILLVAVRRQSLALRRERERLNVKLEVQDRFLSVATLATGFAHELATPLGTISIAASELVDEGDADGFATVIQKEVARCELVLNQLREVGQEAVAGAAPDMVVGALVEEALELLPQNQRSRVSVLMEEEIPKSIRSAGVCEALLVVVRNALQASPERSSIDLKISQKDDTVIFEVVDDGPGFDDEALLHWAEPFFTTRDGGLGLGLYFVRRLVSSLGGNVEIRNRKMGGAAVEIQLPLSEPSGGKVS